MARQSFTLREDTFEGGSYLQYYPEGASASSSASAGAASATYLRGDDVQIASESALLKSLSYFDGYASDYRTVTLDWGFTLEDVDLRPFVGDLAPKPYELVISYSYIGPPATIPEGETLLVTRSVSSIVHKNVEGLWAYYTMFVHYLSVNDDYYEPVAQRSVLLPNSYGTVDDMYARIPMWYQDLDEKTNGDLYKYLSIFGWDMDYMRTVLDYMISMKDPRIAEVTQLNHLAKDLGIDFRAQELGTDRLRKLLDNIGTIRSTKGTPFSIQEELSAITGSDVIVDSTTNTIKVYNQRCNLVKDPMVENGVQMGLDGGSPLTKSNLVFDVGQYDTGWTEEDEPGYTPEPAYNKELISGANKWDPVPPKGGSAPEPGLGSESYVEGYLFDGGGPADTGFIPIIGSNQSWVGYPDPETGEYGILETQGADIAIRAGDEFYFSVQAYDSDVRVLDSILSVGLYTAGGFSEGQLIVKTETYREINGVKYWKIVVPDDYLLQEDGTTPYGFAVLSLAFTPTSNDSHLFYENFTRILFERNFAGTYFDGDTRLGGWIVDEQNSISDFRWRNPTNINTSFPAQAFSVYSANYHKTKKVVQRLLSSIIPVTELITEGVAYSNRVVTDNLKYTVTYDNIPGF